MRIAAVADGERATGILAGSESELPPPPLLLLLRPPGGRSG